MDCKIKELEKVIAENNRQLYQLKLEKYTKLISTYKNEIINQNYDVINGFKQGNIEFNSNYGYEINRKRIRLSKGITFYIDDLNISDEFITVENVLYNTNIRYRLTELGEAVFKLLL